MSNEFNFDKWIEEYADKNTECQYCKVKWGCPNYSCVQSDSLKLACEERDLDNLLNISEIKRDWEYGKYIGEMTIEKWLEHFPFRKEDIDLKRCNCCGEIDQTTSFRRQNTQYEDNYENYIYVCDFCYEEIESCWEEMWQDYYSSRL